MSKTLTLLPLVLAIWLPQVAIAQHSDIEFGYSGGVIEIEDHGGIPGTIDASWIFEGDFPTSGLSQNFTSDPGFASEVAEGLGVNPGDQIWIGALLSPSLGGALQYHDGVSFTSTSATITIEDNAGVTSDLVANESGFSGDNPLFLQEADSIGDIHSHVDFTLSAGAAQGAYGLLFDLQTTASGIGNSDPFWIVFNHGLDETVFEGTVLSAFGAAQVPEPGSALILAAGAGMLLARRRRT